MNRTSMLWCRLFVVIFCIVLCAAAATPIHAQQNAIAVVSGTVVDPVGSAVPNAAVVVKNESSDIVGRAATNLEGKFSVTNLPAGKYTLEVSAPGFALAQ